MISDIKCNRIQEQLKISNLFSLTKYDIKWDEIDHKRLKYTKDGFYKKQKSNNPKDSYQLFVQWDSRIF